MSDDNHVKPGRDQGFLLPYGFTKPAFHTIPVHSVSNFSAYGESHTRLRSVTANKQHQQQSSANSMPSALHALDID